MRRAFISNHSGPGPFALRFRLLMSYHDLTLAEIAAGTRCAVSTVGTWKNGRVPSSARVREKLAEIFHVSVEYLLEGRPAAGQAGVKGVGEPETLAGKLLDDMELLVQALAAYKVSADGEGAEGKPAYAEAEEGKPAGNGRPPKTPKPESTRLRRQVEGYMRQYLDRAERVPGGLEHAWVQLRREFPLDLYEKLR
jgi:transcriptional regulator with XRE-family HTH domain